MESCDYCGSEIVRDTGKLSLICPECFGRNEEQSRFCTGCGVAFQPYQVNAELMSAAKPTAKFMHCLPARRGEEVTNEIIDGVQSVVFDQAENRMHMQKAILAYLLNQSVQS